MKQTYYYRSISPTQIAGLADAILEKVFGFEQVPDMVTLSANAQGHFDFKAQFMYEDSIPFPQKRSTASKEKEKQKVKDIALAFFRTANEKVKANKQPKLENQDSVRQMFRDKDVDRGAFPSDFPDLFPIQYLEWQSTEPIFHPEYPKNIHYYEVRFRVELPVIAAGHFGSAQRPAVEKIENDSVQNPETPVARLSSSAPTNHAPQTQKLVDTFLGNATQTPTVKATVQNEYIVLHINPDDKRYEIMGVESCFVQIAGQEITGLLEMAGENIGLYFLQEGNLKVPYWTAEGKVAASGIKSISQFFNSLGLNEMPYGFSHQTKTEGEWTIEETSLKIFFTDGTSLKSKSKAQLKDLIMSISGDFPNGEAEKIRQHISGIINGLGLQYATKVEQDSEGASHYTAKKPEEIEKLIELEILRTLIATKIVAGLPTIWNTIDEIKRVKYELLVEYELICNQNYDLIKNTEKRYYYDTAKAIEKDDTIFNGDYVNIEQRIPKYVCTKWLDHNLGSSGSWGGTQGAYPVGYLTTVVFLNPDKPTTYHSVQYTEAIEIPTGYRIRSWEHIIRTSAHELFIHVCKDAHIWHVDCVEQTQWERAVQKRKEIRDKYTQEEWDNNGPSIEDIMAIEKKDSPVFFVRNNIATTWEHDKVVDKLNNEQDYIENCATLKKYDGLLLHERYRRAKKEYICLFCIDYSVGNQLSINQRIKIISNIK